MRRLVIALLVLLVPAAACAAPVRVFDQAPKEMILSWINKYRHNPDVERVPSAIRGLSRLGLLSDPEGSGVYIGFLAGILASNPEDADALIAKIFPLPPEQHWAIVRAIAYSGLPEWQKLLQRTAERMPARRVMIEKFLASKLPTLEQAPIEKEVTFGEKVRANLPLARHFSRAKSEIELELTPDVLDTLWGYFYATGSNRPLLRMVLMLRWMKERDSLERLTLGSMAKYTLATNSARNPDLLATMKWAATQPQPDTVKPVLAEVIEAAETVETGKLRNEALAAIDELKRKGPGMKRDLSLWAQVGEGALAIGCIAAAVAGQVEFGVPCVVGGIATSAALRLWDRPN
jgi:hypothetical protein